MLTLRGRVMNVYHVPMKTTRDGEIREPYAKVQIMGEIPLPQGGVQMDLIDLRTDRGNAFERAKGQLVECAVRPYAFAPEGGGSVIGGVSMIKGVEIKLLKDDGTPGGILAQDGPTNAKKAS
jgi:hypothetical protein